MTAALQTTAHMETRALRRNLAWAPWEAACCSRRFGFSLILPLLLTLSPLNQTPVHSIIVLRGKQGFPQPTGEGWGEGTGMRQSMSRMQDFFFSKPLSFTYVFLKSFK